MSTASERVLNHKTYFRHFVCVCVCVCVSSLRVKYIEELKCGSNDRNKKLKVKRVKK